jgi:hypothetical protein
MSVTSGGTAPKPLQARWQLLGRGRLGGDGDDLRAGKPAPTSYQSQIDAGRRSSTLSPPLRWTEVPAGTGSVLSSTTRTPSRDVHTLGRREYRPDRVHDECCARNSRTVELWPLSS